MKLNLAIISLSKDFCRVHSTHYNDEVCSNTLLMPIHTMVRSAHSIRSFLITVAWSCIAKQGAKVRGAKSCKHQNYKLSLWDFAPRNPC